MRVLMIILLSFSAGAVASLTELPAVLEYCFAGLLLADALFLFIHGRSLKTRVGLICLFCAAGLVYGDFYQQCFISPQKALYGHAVQYTCEVSDYPRSTAYGSSVEVHLLTGSGHRPKATIYLKESPELRPGDLFTAELSLSDSAASGSWYSYSDGIFIIGSTKELLDFRPAPKIPLRYLPRKISHTLEQSIVQSFPEDTVGYAVALTTGNRALLAASDRAILQRAGIFHAMALSGMHMSVLVGCLFFLRRRKRLRALLGIPICIAFAIITGCSPSVVRAAVLQCLLLAAGAFRRETDAPTSLSLAAGILIIQNPWVIMSWGAQLSFASVIGLMLFGWGLYTRLVKLVPRGILGTLWKPIAATLSATLAALSLTGPLMVFEFGYISLVAPLTNLLCAWMVELCFAGCLLTALTGLVLPAVSSGMGWLFSWGFRYLRAMAGLLTRVPYAAIYTGSKYFLFWLILLYVIVAVLLLRPKTPKLLPTCLTVFTLFVCIFLSLLESMVPSFTALDVGQGQCLLFQSGTASVMVDCGSANQSAGTIAAEHLTAVGENELDLLILTHYDSDHISGTLDLLRQVRVKQLLLPATASPAREELETLAMELGTEILHAEADTSIYLGKYQLEVFVPPEEHAADSAENDNSLAILSRIPNLQVLITGDMDTIGEAQLLEGHTLPELDVLVAGHHGAKTSTSTRLLAAGKPKAVVISVGKNSYGHPSDEALHRIALSGAALYRTDEAGLSGCLTFRPGQQPAG